ncbi:M24 family metallopeptidase [Burkholderia pseudomultivorans]|uniref:Aminopeptidase YpdF n=1 Tax=Burkholderia pseudomultivorans TaxID=1207504 RepID=A0ABU2E6X5_9BURK|nr:M24 family metallopeptidase [Burkholderia pseudomultivorans]MDR8730181.1 Aminopeptidase YpdF [Burkholderia pseudomultivorans]MDR8735412.1 Aminopeptidase YpdF [Burkholderia pseudomultivorans]MDR8741212.1 Aminopeptidase YpdF [Burkholderia pseudomultivorans]MDR8755378.1 Aminopeptidase YpdF [Burkholderia pseudomultivorans]MDR8777626.1 Aminopeptidase YpdF [Burkholderia pseudomultivorans]
MIDRLKYSFSGLPPYDACVADTQAGLSRLLDTLRLDAVIVTSQDEFVTEYLPRRNNPRYAVSGFDGSAGCGIFLAEAAARALGVPPFVLFVDGRYHLQAERQCDPARVRVEKLGLNVSMWPALADWLVARADLIKRIGYDGWRLSVAQRDRLLDSTRAAQLDWTSLVSREIDRAVALPGWVVERPIFALPEAMTGTSVAHNIATLNRRLAAQADVAAAATDGGTDGATAFVTCASDDLGHLLNSRGYHIPNASSHLGYLFVIGEQVALFLPEGCDRCPVELASYPALQVIRRDFDALARFLAQFAVGRVCYGFESVNCALVDTVRRVWPHAPHADCNPVEAMRAAKTPAALDRFRDAFARSSAAIAETMRWAKAGEPGLRHSEYDLARAISDAYGARGAVALTFPSVAANGANSASAHYTAASAEVELGEGELVLLDSGAYYEAGFATDCTRVVLRRTRAETVAQPWQREIYTVALKACIKGLVTHFPKDATGADVDAAVRQVCRDHGHDFGHGTGHGVGIHVHEGGVRFAPGARYGLVPNAVVSVEPGIYLPGKGGVRIENIVIIRPSEQDADKVRFENIVTVGYDWDLIDVDLLTDDERDYLRDYERLCVERGTQVTACPLL